jgi:hypothetical protein
MPVLLERILKMNWITLITIINNFCLNLNNINWYCFLIMCLLYLSACFFVLLWFYIRADSVIGPWQLTWARKSIKNDYYYYYCVFLFLRKFCCLFFVFYLLLLHMLLYLLQFFGIIFKILKLFREILAFQKSKKNHARFELTHMNDKLKYTLSSIVLRMSIRTREKKISFLCFNLEKKIYV